MRGDAQANEIRLDAREMRRMRRAVSAIEEGALMPVYVDAPIWPFRRMKMSHLIADTLEELHAMADAIGVSRRWFQQPGKNIPIHACPHYDICKSKRALAVKLGAVDLAEDRQAFVDKMREIRTASRERLGWKPAPQQERLDLAGEQ